MQRLKKFTVCLLRNAEKVSFYLEIYCEIILWYLKDFLL